MNGQGAARQLQKASPGSLTTYEVKGLHADLSLADGHAAHEWPNASQAFSRATLFDEALELGPVRTKRDMISQWALIAGEASAPQTPHVVTPTASVSIDIVAAAAAHLKRRVVLVDPAFDNLSEIHRRRGVQLRSVLEKRLRNDPLGALASLGPGDALFLVSPNNPTGAIFDGATFDAILQACADRGVDLILDRTFRFFGGPATVDTLGHLLRSGVGFVVIEDTGKTWPTLEVKTSVIFFSAGCWESAIRSVFEEIFLLQSSFVMQAFADLFRIERATGFPGTLHALVDQRRTQLRAILETTPLRVAPESVASTLPVEWLDSTDTGLSDLALVDEIVRKSGVHLLPGRQFYWSRGDLQPHNRIRVSLLRRQRVFEESLARLEAFFREGW